MNILCYYFSVPYIFIDYANGGGITIFGEDTRLNLHPIGDFQFPNGSFSYYNSHKKND